MEQELEKLLRGGPLLHLLDQRGAEIRETYDLKKPDIRVLYYLSHNPEHNSARDIQSYFGMNKGYISQTVDKLQKRGLLQATADPEDRRMVHYTITEAAADILREIDRMWASINDRIFEGVTEEEMKVFRRAAHKIARNIQEMIT